MSSRAHFNGGGSAAAAAASAATSTSDGRTKDGVGAVPSASSTSAGDGFAYSALEPDGLAPMAATSTSERNPSRGTYALFVKNITLLSRQRGLCACQIATPIVVLTLLMVLQEIIRVEVGATISTNIPSLFLPLNIANIYIPLPPPNSTPPVFYTGARTSTSTAAHAAAAGFVFGGGSHQNVYASQMVGDETSTSARDTWAQPVAQPSLTSTSSTSAWVLPIAQPYMSYDGEDDEYYISAAHSRASAARLAVTLGGFDVQAALNDAQAATAAHDMYPSSPATPAHKLNFAHDHSVPVAAALVSGLSLASGLRSGVFTHAQAHRAAAGARLERGFELSVYTHPPPQPQQPSFSHLSAHTAAASSVDAGSIGDLDVDAAAADDDELEANDDGWARRQDCVEFFLTALDPSDSSIDPDALAHAVGRFDRVMRDRVTPSTPPPGALANATGLLSFISSAWCRLPNRSYIPSPFFASRINGVANHKLKLVTSDGGVNEPLPRRSPPLSLRSPPCASQVEVGGGDMLSAQVEVGDVLSSLDDELSRDLDVLNAADQGNLMRQPPCWPGGSEAPGDHTAQERSGCPAFILPDGAFIIHNIAAPGVSVARSSRHVQDLQLGDEAASAHQLQLGGDRDETAPSSAVRSSTVRTAATTVTTTTTAANTTAAAAAAAMADYVISATIQVNTLANARYHRPNGFSRTRPPAPGVTILDPARLAGMDMLLRAYSGWSGISNASSSSGAGGGLRLPTVVVSATFAELSTQVRESPCVRMLVTEKFA